ncbi:MAG: class I SAM-dependent methyltransferase [Methanophagales archaeon]|nr:class I SAM-dependent methyltransferase [Methanophagales archaeon]
MIKTKPFDEYASQYEDWFKMNKFAFESELQAIRTQLPKSNNGIEIGVGSGQFAAPLGIKIGIDPSEKMREIAQKRGIEVIDGLAESLPFDDSQFDFTLMTTTICFVDDIEASFQEAYRILKPDGFLIIGFIDRESPIGRLYQQHKGESVFYRIATFYTVDEVISNLKKAGFKNFNFTQTIFHNLAEIRDIEPIKEGYGEGSFVVIRAIK